MKEFAVLNENYYVVKTNRLIEAIGNLGTLEEKLFDSLVSQIQITDEDFRPYYIKVKDMGEFIGLHTNAVYERLREAAENLSNEPVTLESSNDKGKRQFISTRLISSTLYQEGEGYMVMHIDPILKPYLLAINGKETPFTSYMLGNILRLDTDYEIKLYRLLKQYERVKSRTFEFEDLKKKIGADTPSYQVFAEFDRRVLKKTIVGINKQTDIFIESCEKIKTGKKITHLKFVISPKYNKERIEKEQDEKIIKYYADDIKFAKDKEKCGMADIDIDIVNFYNLIEIAIDVEPENVYDYMCLTADYVKEQKPKHFIGYFKKALRKNYIKF